MWPRIGGLLIPAGIILIFNEVVFVLVFRKLGQTFKGRSTVSGSVKTQRLKRFQNAVVILTLMGLTWTFGYLSVIRPASAVVQGLFVAFNSLQGFFIFIMYCVRQREVRQRWQSILGRCCCCCMRTSPTKQSSSSDESRTMEDTRVDWLIISILKVTSENVRISQSVSSPLSLWNKHNLRTTPNNSV